MKHAGTTRPFTASTGAERTLSAEERTEHLEELLDGLGLIAKVKGKGSKGGERKLASESKAKSVGHLRELEKETEVTLNFLFTLCIFLVLMRESKLMYRMRGV